MITLVIHGMPHLFSPGGVASDQVFHALLHSLQVATANSLGINTDDVSVFFPADLVRSGLGEELVCFVEGVWEKPFDVRKNMAGAIVRVFRDFAAIYLLHCKKVEVLVRHFSQDLDVFVAGNLR